MENVKLLILFGSKASGLSNKNSDLDVAVLTDRTLTLSDKMVLIEKIAKKLKANEDKIDLIDLRQTSPLLRYEIATKGKLLEGNESDFLRFQVLSWKVYQDTRKLRQAREKNLETALNVR